MDRRTFVAALAGGLLAAPCAAGAQQAGKVYRIGFLSSASAARQVNRLEALRTGLRELGYVEGKNIVVEYRWAEGNYDRLPDLAAELVRLNVDVLVTSGTPGTLAAMQATSTIPIVVAVAGDVLPKGLAASLARPGGNVTGSTDLTRDLNAKRLELLKEAVPRMSRVAVLFNPHNAGTVVKDLDIVAKSMKLGLLHFEVSGPGDFDGAFTAMVKKGVDAVAITSDGILLANASRIADLAAKRRLPSAGDRDFGEAGGMIGYGPSIPDLYRRVATYVDKILKGAKPADLPIEQPTKFNLVINLKTAKALGLTIPQSLLARADQVIE